MVKLFIGNLPPAATQAELKSLFEQFGKVTECDIITNYAFVHMEDKKSANEAVHNLNHYKLHGVSINVEHSRGKPRASTKLHVSSISPDCTSEELREKFEEYGTVLECDIVKDYAFVHMEKAEEALEAIRNLNNVEFKAQEPDILPGVCGLFISAVNAFVQDTITNITEKVSQWNRAISDVLVKKPLVQTVLSEKVIVPRPLTMNPCRVCSLKGKKMHVQLSTSRLRVTPGMGERSRCYRCGKDGHWSGVCPLDQMAPELGPPYPDPFADPYVPMRSAAAAYAERILYDERRSLIDYYHHYRIRPSSYDTLMDRPMPPIPPPSMSTLSHRKRLESYPYERHLLPPPLPSYYSRDRSPLRRTTATASVEAYGMERRLNPAVRSSPYDTDTARYMRETYADRSGFY